MSHKQALTWGLTLLFVMSVLSGCGGATPTPIVIVPTDVVPVPQANPPANVPQPTEVPATEPAAAAEEPTTAVTADGTLTLAPSPTLPAPIDRPFLMKIDRISVVVGRGTLLEGRVANGTLQANENIEILGTGNTVLNPSILAMLISNTMRDQVTVGDYAGILVGGVEATTLSPGMLLAKAGEFESYEEALQQLQ
jgi:translation elongation factor EF-Tu-like GTPase